MSNAKQGSMNMQCITFRGQVLVVAAAAAAIAVAAAATTPEADNTCKQNKSKQCKMTSRNTCLSPLPIPQRCYRLLTCHFFVEFTILFSEVLHIHQLDASQRKVSVFILFD